jgi:hypothetical protein
VPGVGRLIPEDAPELFADLLAGWLSRENPGD